MEEIEINPDKDYMKMQEEDLKELESLRQELEGMKLKNADPTLPIKDAKIKLRVSRLCSKLISRTPQKEKKIRKTCSMLIGAFSGHTYGDKLDEVIKIAKELENKKGSEDAVYELFRLMQEILEEYGGEKI